MKSMNNLLHALLMLQTVLVLLSPYNTIVVSGLREEAPIKHFAECTSRTLRTDDGGSTYYSAVSVNMDLNSTDFDERGLDDGDGISDDLPPYCPLGYYCDLVEITNHTGDDYVQGICRDCAGGSERCLDGRFMLSNTTTASNFADVLEMASVGECQERCGIETNLCSSVEDCPNGLFCNFESDGEGHCHGCPVHSFYCQDIMYGDKNLTSKGLDTCVSSCDLQCRVGASLTTTDTTTSISTEVVDVNGIYNTIQVSRTGPIVDCGLGQEICEGAKGAVCLIERGLSPFINKTRNCADGGGVAAVIYNVAGNCENIDGSFFTSESLIPAITLTHMDGKSLLEEARAIAIESPDSPMYATVDVGGYDVLPGRCVFGCMEGLECSGANQTCDWENGSFGDCEEVESRQFCNGEASFLAEYLPCLGENEYCDFSLGDLGFCNTCVDDPIQCFYSGLDGLGVKECAARCTNGKSDEVELESSNCKVCPVLNFTLDDVNEGFTSTLEEVENPCSFCAEKNATEQTTCSPRNRWDMEYPDRTIRLFGSGVECWAVAEFYRSLNLDADSAYCESARTFNYVCGCSDSVGYAGANTTSKQIALVWLPRIGAILSILGSIGMIIGVMRDKEKKKKVIGELIITLSCFDIIGSLGYAFTSLPIPEQDYIYGAEGNPASCTAQGFFIQLGTISLYINVSIAFYYMLIIQFSWREHKLRKSPVYYLLYVVPITVGAIFAFAAIPFYENAILWCNNSQKYWSEIPVAIAIAIATYLMLSLCWFVYKSEKASARYSARSSTNDRASLSKQFFYQSMVYLGAFYLTWPAYLALQVMLARGNAFSNYGFYLFAGTAVTLQGFWNFLFHSGLQLRMVRKRVSSALSRAIPSVMRSAPRSQNFSESSTGGSNSPRRASTRQSRQSRQSRRSSSNQRNSSKEMSVDTNEPSTALSIGGEKVEE